MSKIEQLSDLPPFLDGTTVAKLRGCQTATVRLARRKGLLVGHKVNERVYLYSRESVLKWLGFEEVAK
jgi:DNA-binding transcriptional MerR regulator